MPAYLYDSEGGNRLTVELAPGLEPDPVVRAVRMERPANLISPAGEQFMPRALPPEVTYTLMAPDCEVPGTPAHPAGPVPVFTVDVSALGADAARFLEAFRASCETLLPAVQAMGEAIACAGLIAEREVRRIVRQSLHPPGLGSLIERRSLTREDCELAAEYQRFRQGNGYLPTWEQSRALRAMEETALEVFGGSFGIYGYEVE